MAKERKIKAPKIQYAQCNYCGKGTPIPIKATMAEMFCSLCYDCRDKKR